MTYLNEIVETLYVAIEENGLLSVLDSVFPKPFSVRIGFDASLMGRSVELLELSNRAGNALHRIETPITTIGALIAYINEGSLPATKNLGAKTVTEIKTKILLFGYLHLNEKGKKEFLSDLVSENQYRPYL